MPDLSEDDWSDLVDEIVSGRMIPVIGERAITVGENNTPLYPILARDLAERLEIPLEHLRPSVNIEAVARAHLKRANRNLIYSRLHRLLETPRTPGKLLQQLASIDTFPLYVSTTVDALLECALQKQWPDKKPVVISYYPTAEAKDLPCPAAKLPGPTVYHLLGRATRAPDQYVAWEDDLLAFVIALAHDFTTKTMRQLDAALQSHSLLTIGLDLSDWILLLLLRMTRHRSLWEDSPHQTWVTETLEDESQSSLVFLVGGVRGGIRRIAQPIDEFVDELAARFHVRRNTPASSRHVVRSAPGPRCGADPVRPVFISYAREDQEAALNIKAGLEAEGCLVYFDHDRLVAGMNFERELEAQVRAASVFVSLISATTEGARGPRFFRLERSWAAEQAKWLSDAERPGYYVPVIVTPEAPRTVEQEPDIFRTCQWTHCPGGTMSRVPGFAPRIAELQRRGGLPR